MRPTWRGVLVPTNNDAEDDLWPRGERLLLKLFARFFCLIRRACRLRADSSLRVVEVWKERDVDDDANVNVAAALKLLR
jgi:hypothetical protein